MIGLMKKGETLLMKTKKILAGAVTLLTVATLAACSNAGAGGKDIVTMKGGTITSTEFYERVKTNSAAQQVLVEMVISEVFEAQYGKNVSEKDVDKAYDEQAKQHGDAFQQALTSAGLTPETYRKQLRTNLLVDYAIKAAAKKEVTEAAYKEAYDAYTPEVKAQVIKLDDEAKAKEVLGKAQAEGADFTALVKEHSTDKEAAKKDGEIKFDSTSTTVSPELQTAIFALNEGQVGAAVVPVVDAATYSTSYYVVKLNTKTKKAEDWKEYKSILKDIIIKSKSNDGTFVTSVVSKALKDANVKVKDEAFQSVLSQYITTPESDDAAKTEKDSKE